jgi:hypothetical protein
MRSIQVKNVRKWVMVNQPKMYLPKMRGRYKRVGGKFIMTTSMEKPKAKSGGKHFNKHYGDINDTKRKPDTKLPS